MKERRLRRRWARLCWLLLVFAGGFAVFGALLRMIPFLMVSCVLIVMELILQLAFLRCTNCGREIAPPRWDSGRRFYCRRCGKPFLFDDDPDDR